MREGLLRPRGARAAGLGAGGGRRDSSRPLTRSGARTVRGPEAGDGLRLGGVGAIQVVEAEDVEDVLDGLVQAGQPEVAPVAPDLLDGAHHGPETRARDVAETRAVDYDLELLQRDSLLQCPLEEAHRVGVDEPLGIEEDDVSDVPALDRQLAHPGEPTISHPG